MRLPLPPRSLDWRASRLSLRRHPCRGGFRTTAFRRGRLRHGPCWPGIWSRPLSLARLDLTYSATDKFAMCMGSERSGFASRGPLLSPSEQVPPSSVWECPCCSWHEAWTPCAASTGSQVACRGHPAWDISGQRGPYRRRLHRKAVGLKLP